MNEILSILGRKAFSEKELMSLVDKNTNLVLYPDLQKYRNMDQLLGPAQQCIILYVTNVGPTSVFGHWVCMFKIDNRTCEFYDPYAYYPDEELDFSKYGYPAYLTDLIENGPYDIIYNTHELQDRRNPDSSTCGRHCAVRLNLKAIPIKQYAKIMNSVRGLTPDGIVTMMTSFAK